MEETQCPYLNECKPTLQLYISKSDSSNCTCCIQFGVWFDFCWLSTLRISDHKTWLACHLTIAKAIRISIQFANYKSTCRSFATIKIGYQFMHESSSMINKSYTDLFILKMIRKSNRTPKLGIAYRPERFAKQIGKSISETCNRFCDS